MNATADKLLGLLDRVKRELDELDRRVTALEHEAPSYDEQPGTKGRRDDA